MKHLFKKFLCKLGYHHWESTDDIYYVNFPLGRFSESCSICNQKSIITAARLGFDTKIKRRILVNEY